MKLGFMTIAKVYRKKDVQEITDRATGRVTGEYYPVILDDGEDTLDATVPKDVYNGIEEEKIYLFAGTQHRSQESQPFSIQSMSHGAKILLMNLQSRHTTALQCRLKMSSRKTLLQQLPSLQSNQRVISWSLPTLL